jgi:hypothetical protein
VLESFGSNEQGTMPTNKKPVLSVLVDGAKRDQFSQLCSSHGRPMAWAINAFIDQCLENDSIDGVFLPPTTTRSEGLAELREIVTDIRENLMRIGVYMPQEAIEEDIEASCEAETSTAYVAAEETPEQKKFRAEMRKIRKLSNAPRMEAQIAQQLAALGMEDD